MLAVVVSRADSASVHVGDHLQDLADWREHTDSTRPDAEGGGTVYRTGWQDGTPTDRAVELREFEDLHLNIQGAADAFGRVDGVETDREEGVTDEPVEPDMLVFVSRHAGETGPLLTAHHTGNFGDAEFGGETGALARACPNAHRNVLEALREHAPDGYEVGMECTHHGPSEVGVPSMFVEVGSAEPQWDDPDAAHAVAKAVLDLRGVAPDAPIEGAAIDSGADRHESAAAASRRRQLVGFGGGHYAPRFERIARETDWAVGHVAADWVLEAMGDPRENRETLRRAFERSDAARAVVEGEYPRLVETVEDLGYGVVSETWVRETSGVPLALVERIEDALGGVDEGVRFGERSTEFDDVDEFEVLSLPGDLVAEAEGIDADATRAAVEAATLAFETTQNGTRVGERAAVNDEAALADLADDLAGVLDRDYDEVDVIDGAVVAHEQAFDPERARELGVPEGPKFGRLSSGAPVEVDGQTVDPEDVHEDRTVRFPY